MTAAPLSPTDPTREPTPEHMSDIFGPEPCKECAALREQVEQRDRLTLEASEARRLLSVAWTEVSELKRGRDTLLKVLEELVACKDLKGQLESLPIDGDPFAIAEEYHRRKPLAWGAARAAIAAVRKPT